MKKLIPLFTLVFSVLSHAAYEDHFPTYFEYCSGTQWKTQSGEVGGTPGHGFVYVHGMCKDYRSAYPQVIPCSEVSPEMKKKHPHEGVGVSLDKNFRNVMWVAIPGRDLMLFGDLESQSINKPEIEKHIQKISKLKVFDEVLSKSDALKPFTPGTQEYLSAIALDTLGTDHAVNWARKLHCVKIPVPQATLPKAAAFLNQSNNQYRNGKEYIWSKEANNCIHLSVNTSHAMGFSKEIKVDQNFVKKFFNLALPANAFMMYSDMAVLKKPSLKLLKNDLKKNNFSIVQVGSLMKIYEVFPSGDHFKTEDLTQLTAPRIKKPLKLLDNPDKYQKKYVTAETSELKENAESWAERYTNLLAKLKKSERGSELEAYLQSQLKLSQKILGAE